MKGNELYIRTLLAEQEGIVNGTLNFTGRDTININGDIIVDEFFIRNEFTKKKRVVENLPNTVESVLDLGCGNGRFYEFISKHYPNVKYTGIDTNNGLLSEARKKYGNDKFFNMDIFFNISEIKADIKMCPKMFPGHLVSTKQILKSSRIFQGEFGFKIAV